jgi:hypothetical protein
VTRGTCSVAEARERAAHGVSLSDRARAELLRFAHEGAEIAGELAGLEGDGEAAYRDAREQLLAIRQGLLENLGLGFFTAHPDRRYALRCVIAWTARRAPSVLRHELRNFAQRMEVTS